MTSPHINIRQIKQIDNFHFQIDWSDGTVEKYRLSELQKRCPCAGCIDETTNQRRLSAPLVSDGVKAKSIQSVGYGLRFQFTEGCSFGIYSFAYLKNSGISF